MADSDRLRSVAVVVTAVAQAAVGLGAQFLADPASTTGVISDENRSPVTPAGYAFTVWGLIYLASLALALYQARPDQRGREVHRRTGWWLVGGFAASTGWVPIFSTRTIWLSQLVILALVGCLAVAACRFTRLGPAPTRTERLALRLPVTLYLGWSLLATVAGFGATFRSLGMPERATWVTAVSLLLVLAATVASVVVVGRLVAVAGFAFTTCWALVAVVVASSSGAVRGAAVIALLLILAVLVVRTSKSRRPGAVLFG
jgi:benzodiazapine receptor